MEAKLFGLPVVTTPFFGVLEQIVEARDGFIYELGDMETWRRRIVQLASDESLCKVMSQAAKRSFWQLATYEEMLHSYRCVLNASGAFR